MKKKWQEKFNLYANTAEGLILKKSFTAKDHGLKLRKLKLKKKGKKRWSKEAIKQKQRKKKIIQVKVKASNNSISHCINYTGGCSIIHLQSNVTKL